MFSFMRYIWRGKQPSQSFSLHLDTFPYFYVPFFHSFHGLRFALTLLLTLFHHHVSLCLVEPFVKP